MSTEAQLTANRANAQLSTGPSSAEGKAKSSLNAVKTGLTGRTVVLPSEDVEIYQKHVALFVEKFEPATGEEHYLVQSIADTEWRLLRIPSLEAGFYAIGRVELGGSFADQLDPATHESMIQAHIARAYSKDFNSLARQESRLRKQRNEDIAQLVRLQEDRKWLYQGRLERALNALDKARFDRTTFDPAEIGFEFTEEFLKPRLVAFMSGGSSQVAKFERSTKLNSRLTASKGQ